MLSSSAESQVRSWHEHKPGNGNGRCPGNSTHKAKDLAMEEHQSLGGLLYHKLRSSLLLTLQLSQITCGPFSLHAIKGLWIEMTRQCHILTSSSIKWAQYCLSHTRYRVYANKSCRGHHRPSVFTLCPCSSWSTSVLMDAGLGKSPEGPQPGPIDPRSLLSLRDNK